MALGDILTCRIRSTGWEAEIDIDGLAVGGTYAFGDLDSDIANATVAFTVVSEGFDTSGNQGTKTRTVVGTAQRMKAYPNQASAEESVTDGVLTVTIALNEYIYDDDKNGGAGTSGTDPMVSIAAGFYTAGGTASHAVSGMPVTNLSTEDYPRVIARWATVPYQRVVTVLDLEVVAFHRFAEYGKPVACVGFTCDDGTAPPLVPASAMSKSVLADSLPCYVRRISASDYAPHAQVTFDFTAYPWVGDENTVRTSSGGDPDGLDLGPLPTLMDPDDDYGVTVASIDVDTGDDDAGTVVDIADLGTEVPYATVRAALADIATYNNTNHGREDVNAAVIYLMSDDHSFGEGATTSTSDKTWVTITRHPTVTKANARIVGSPNRGSGTNRCRFYDMTFVPASTNFVLVGAASRWLWLDNVDIACPAKNPYTLSRDFTATYNTFVTTDYLDWPFSNYSTSNMPALIRGCVSQHARGFIQTAAYGCPVTLTSSILSPSTSTSGYSLSLERTNSIGAYCTHINSNYPPMHGSVSDDDTATVCNVLEGVVDSHQQIVSIASKCQWDRNNLLYWHNTVAGNRSLIGYNAEDTIPKSGDLKISHISIKYNSDQWEPTKHDVFAMNGLLISGWSVLYGVGWVGNNSEERPDQFDPNFHGIGCTRATVAGYTDDQSLTTGGVGDGDYHPATGSVLIGKIKSARDVLIPWDIEGNAYTAGGYAGAFTATTSPPEPSIGGYRFWTYS